MKKVQSGIFSFQSFIIVALSNIFVLFYLFNKDVATSLMIKAFVFINLLCYLLTFPRNHFFLYDDEEFLVRNSMNGFIKKDYSLKDIEKIEFKRDSFVGGAIAVHFKKGGSKTFPSDIPRYRLEEMIEELEKEGLTRN